MSKKPKADVCVIVPNYNNGRYLDEFIESVIHSTVEPAMLLIVDDGSTDNSAEKLSKYATLSYMKVIYLETNKGLTTALNTALENANAKYIMRADPDDILLPEKIYRQFAFMEQHPEVDILGCNLIYFREHHHQINPSNFPTDHKSIVKAYLRGEHGVQHPTVFIRSEVYKCYRYQPVFPGEDYEIFARMVKDGRRFANLKDKLYLMRVHTDSSTSNLQLSGIKNTFAFRDKIFGTRTGTLRIKTYFIHITHYRKYQMSSNFFIGGYHLLIAIVFYPSKLFKRLFSF